MPGISGDVTPIIHCGQKRLHGALNQRECQSCNGADGQEGKLETRIDGIFWISEQQNQSRQRRRIQQIQAPVKIPSYNHQCRHQCRAQHWSALLDHGYIGE